MKTFKFLKNNEITNYRGEWSQNAISIVSDYLSNELGSGQNIQRFDAMYNISEVTYLHGELAGAVVDVYPILEPRTKVKFFISVGRVTPFITDHIIENI